MSVALFATYNSAARVAEHVHAETVAECHRANALRRTLSVLMESQLADIHAASELAVNPGLRAQYAALVAKTEAIVNDPLIQSRLEVIDCEEL